MKKLLTLLLMLLLFVLLVGCSSNYNSQNNSAASPSSEPAKPSESTESTDTISDNHNVLVVYKIPTCRSVLLFVAKPFIYRLFWSRNLYNVVF